MLMKENANRNWSPADVEYLRTMILDGFTSQSIAHKTGRSICAVESKRKKIGMIKSARPSLWTQDDFERLGSLLKEGLTDKQIARRMSRGQSTVAQYRLKLYPTVRNLTPRPERKPIPRNLRASDVLSMRPLAPQDWDFSRRAYTTTAFLISLLRAGHKPGQGEFAIPSDNRVVRPSDLVGA